MSSIFENVHVWKDSVWIFLYCVAENYPKNPTLSQRKHLGYFLTSLQYVFPCKECREFYKLFLQKKPMDTILHQTPIRFPSYLNQLYRFMEKMYHPHKSLKPLPDLYQKVKTRCTTSSSKSPQIWGKYTWLFLHCITFCFPTCPTKKEIQQHVRFFQSLTVLLPCSHCRQHLREYLQQHPIRVALEQGKQSFIKYCIDLHNFINETYTDKKKLSFSDAKRLVFDNCFQEFKKTQPNRTKQKQTPKINNTVSTKPRGKYRKGILMDPDKPPSTSLKLKL